MRLNEKQLGKSREEAQRKIPLVQEKHGIVLTCFSLFSATSFTFLLMKHFATQLAGSILVGLAPWLTATAQTSIIDYRNSSGTATIEKRTATESSLATSFTFGSYTTATGNSRAATIGSADDIFQLSNQYSAQINGRALVWRQDNTDTYLSASQPDVQVNLSTPFKSQVLLTFSREVTGLTFVIQDIDLSKVSSTAATGGSDFTDEVDFYPLDDDKKPVDMSPSSMIVNIGDPTSCKYVGPATIDGKTQVALRGTDVNGTTSSPDRQGNVSIKFKKPLKTILLTYRNLNTFACSLLRLQTIAFESIGWDSQADLTTTIVNSDAGTLVAGKTGKFTVNFGNVGDLDTKNVKAQVQIAPNLPNVTATGGGTYDPQTGIVAYPTTTIAPYGGSLTSVISYTAPAAGTLVTAVATISTTTSEGLNPSPNTATATARPVGPLPVSLTTFEAQAAGTDARLTWTTASEQNNAYFGVERSSDGQTFTQIGRVGGHGTTLAVSNYAYTDAGGASPVAGPVYYRLRQVDLDGTATYSPVRTIGLAAAGPAAVAIFPNPATPADAAVTLDLRTLPSGTYAVSLVSALGSTVASCSMQGGQNQALTLPATLASGSYLLLVQGNGLHLSQRLARR